MVDGTPRERGPSRPLKPERPQKTIPALVCGSVGDANDYATAVYVEVDPQRSRFGRRESECD